MGDVCEEPDLLHDDPLHARRTVQIGGDSEDERDEDEALEKEMAEKLPKPDCKNHMERWTKTRKKADAYYIAKGGELLAKNETSIALRDASIDGMPDYRLLRWKPDASNPSLQEVLTSARACQRHGG
jgi:hypothetical protein